jgi:hypothetical protein
MRYRHLTLTASLLALALTLGGCESFNPTDWISDKISNKKPLPGDRKEVFPGGVPGVPQGVPAEMVEGYKPPPELPPQVAEEEPKPKPKPKPKQAAAPQSPRPAATVAPQPPPSGPSAAWPSPQQTAGQPAPAQPFPDPPQR